MSLSLSLSLSTESTELCVFSDASDKAIAALAYQKVTHGDGHIVVGFVMGRDKLAPIPHLTIPRLELCAAVLGMEFSEIITEEFDMKIVKYYTRHRQ